MSTHCIAQPLRGPPGPEGLALLPHAAAAMQPAGATGTVPAPALEVDPLPRLPCRSRGSVNVLLARRYGSVTRRIQTPQQHLPLLTGSLKTPITPKIIVL